MKQTKLEERISILESKLERLEYSSNLVNPPQVVKLKRWRAGRDGEYWYIDDDGDIYCDTEDDYAMDNWRYSQRNYFQTEEEAEKHLEYLKAVAILKDSSDFIPNWKDRAQDKYFIIYNDSVYITSSTYIDYGSLVYYRTYSEAVESTNKYKKEWLIYLGVEQ